MSLALRITLSVIAFTAFLVTGFAFSGRAVVGQVEQSLLSLNAQNTNAAASSLLKRGEGTLAQHARVITRDRSLSAALADGDRTALKEALTSTFNRISAKGDVTDLAVYDLQGNAVLELTTSARAARGAVPPIVAQVLDGGRRVFDVSLIDESRFGIAYAVPVLKGRTRIGVVLLAQDLDRKIAELSEGLGGYAFVAQGSADGRQYKLKSQAVDPAMTEADAEVAPEALAETVLRNFAGSKLPFAVVSEGAHFYVVTRETFGVPAGSSTDVLFIALEYTAQRQAENTTLLRASGILLAGVLAFVGVLIFWLGRQMAPLRESTKALSAAANDRDPEPVRAKSRAKEIVSLNKAISSLLRKREAEQVAAREMSSVVAACAAGDFSQRLRTDDKEGLFKDLCADVNRISTSANEGLEAIRISLDHLAQGHLAHEMPEDLQGVFGDIASSMNATAQSLRTVVGQIAEASGRIDQGTTEMSANSDILATNTEKNAAAVEETAAALEQMSQTISAVAKSAEDVRGGVANISREAHSGSALMQRAIDAMKDIQKSSDTIAQVLNVIEDISFQTNLLALNAGVEAARAGNSGRGFAVVAREVQSLAQRSADAAAEISDHIRTASQSVRAGASIVEETGTAFGKIVDAVGASNHTIEEIVGATRETSIGIGEINSATSELDQSTQQNAASFRASQAKVQMVEDQSRELARIVETFDLGTVPAASRIARRSRNAA